MEYELTLSRKTAFSPWVNSRYSRILSVEKFNGYEIPLGMCYSLSRISLTFWDNCLISNGFWIKLFVPISRLPAHWCYIRLKGEPLYQGWSLSFGHRSHCHPYLAWSYPKWLYQFCLCLPYRALWLLSSYIIPKIFIFLKRHLREMPNSIAALLLFQWVWSNAFEIKVFSRFSTATRRLVFFWFNSLTDCDRPLSSTGWFGALVLMKSRRFTVR